MNQLESWTKEGDSPVTENHQSYLLYSQVLRNTRNSVGICVDHHIRLNMAWQPIVDQYREGKVKSTPVRGVK